MIAGSEFAGADGDSLQLSDAKDSSSPARISVRIKNGKAVSNVGNLRLLTNPIKPMSSLANIATALERAPSRTMPIDFGRLLSDHRAATTVKIKLPPGWTASLPKNKAMSGPFGSYEETFVQNGRDLSITRSLTGAKGVIPANRMAELVAWLRLVGNDDAKLIALQKP
jgi:hypothetical protein